MTAVTAPPAVAEPRRYGNLRRLFRDRLAVAAALILVVLVLAAVLAPWLAPNDPYLTNTRLRMLPPVWEARGRWEFLLGTDGLGRCMLSRLLYGLRATLMMGIIATAITPGITLSAITVRRSPTKYCSASQARIEPTTAPAWSIDRCTE